MLLKPSSKILSNQKVKRLPKGKAVTIGVGFRCDLGIVLCSDTQITWKGRHKAYETKQFFYGGTNWTMASVYAGDPQLWKSWRGKFAEFLRAYCKTNSREPSTAKELRDILETALCYFDDLDNDPTNLCLLVGFVITEKEILLVKSEGKVISDVYGFDYVGCGDSSLLRYLAPITAEKNRWLTINQALHIGTYWVLQAKRWVEDCGGDTEAIVLHWNGPIHKRNDATHDWGEQLSKLESDLSNILKALGTAEVKDEELENRLALFCQHMRDEHSRLKRRL